MIDIALRGFPVVGLVAVLLWSGAGFERGVVGPDDGAPGTAEAGEGGVLASAQARLEGRTETIEIGIARAGTIQHVSAQEAQRVFAGEVLATLDCAPDAASLAAARSSVEAAAARRQRILRGARDEARRSARADLRASAARHQRAAEVFGRYKNLWERQGAISRDQLDEAGRGHEVAEAEMQAARWREALLSAAPLPEEVGLADAELARAGAEAEALERRLAQCVVRAPIDGTILRRLVEPGESVVVGATLLHLTDLSAWRARVEVDERDLGLIRLGQRVQLSAGAFGDYTAAARVVSLGGEMGRKTVRSGDPAEKGDRDVLEVLVEIDDPPTAVRVGLRVTAVFLEVDSPAPIGAESGS